VRRRSEGGAPGGKKRGQQVERARFCGVEERSESKAGENCCCFGGVFEGPGRGKEGKKKGRIQEFLHERDVGADR